MTMFDYIIVGGGSAGSVLANRLSARSSNRVLLCEAGIDTPVGNVPAPILDGYAGTAFLNPDFLWNELQVTTEVIPHNDPSRRPRLRQYEQARVLGGGSSINGQLANRGAPHDYDEWEARGARGWTWESVLPYFRKIERDLDFDGPYHGKDGPIPVRRLPPEMWSRAQQGARRRAHRSSASNTFRIRTASSRSAGIRWSSPTSTTSASPPRWPTSIRRPGGDPISRC